MRNEDGFSMILLSGISAMMVGAVFLILSMIVVNVIAQALPDALNE
jgi:hypothetical protein